MNKKMLLVALMPFAVNANKAQDVLNDICTQFRQPLIILVHCYCYCYCYNIILFIVLL